MDLSRQQRLIVMTMAGALLAGLIILGIRSAFKTNLDVFPVEATEKSIPSVTPAKTEKKEEDKAYYVHVCGEVKKPGVYRLAPHSRRFQALETAGGATDNADTSAINLASSITDGEQIYIPKKGQAAPGTYHRRSSGGKSTTKVQFPIDVNRATEAELEAVPGIGPSMAAAIISYRKENGLLTSVEQLTDLPGVGEKKLERLRAYLCVR